MLIAVKPGMVLISLTKILRDLGSIRNDARQPVQSTPETRDRQPLRRLNSAFVIFAGITTRSLADIRVVS